MRKVSYKHWKSPAIIALWVFAPNGLYISKCMALVASGPPFFLRLGGVVFSGPVETGPGVVWKY
jgi:hypothetical protein